MLRGLYTAASGMNAELIQQDVVANNIANATTVGFKKDAAVFEAFPNSLLRRIHDRIDGLRSPAAQAQAAPLVGVLGQGVNPVASPTHFSDGSLLRTDRPLDLGLQGNALFTVQRADGSLAYTRAGNFTLNGERQLATMAGDLVLGSEGQPLVLQGSQVVVDTAGGVKVDGVDAGSLQLAAYEPGRFSKLGENLYVKVPDALEALGEEPKPQAQVLQGFTEQSNVQVVEEMVRMISVMRAYEANQKTIQMQDETLNKLISNVGRPSA